MARNVDAPRQTTATPRASVEKLHEPLPNSADSKRDLSDYWIHEALISGMRDHSHIFRVSRPLSWMSDSLLAESRDFVFADGFLVAPP